MFDMYLDIYKYLLNVSRFAGKHMEDPPNTLQYCTRSPVNYLLTIYTKR